MALTVTPSRRQIAMAVMLLLAVSGGIIRRYAPNPSTLRDVGSLLLVLWLPAVGNLIGFLIGRIPRKPPPVTEFVEGSAFVPQLRAEVQAEALPAEVAEWLVPGARMCTVLVGRHGFTARLAQPVVETLAVAGTQTLELQLLHPAVAARKLVAGADLYLLAGTAGIAKGRVVEMRAQGLA